MQLFVYGKIKWTIITRFLKGGKLLEKHWYQNSDHFMIQTLVFKFK